MLTHEEVGVEAGVLDGIKAVNRFVAVDGDGESCLRAERAADRVGEVKAESLRRFAERVVDDEHRNDLRRFTAGETQRAERGQIIRAVGGRAVSADVVDGSRTRRVAGAGDEHVDVYSCIRRFVGRLSADAELHRVCRSGTRDGPADVLKQRGRQILRHVDAVREIAADVWFHQLIRKQGCVPVGNGRTGFDRIGRVHQRPT